MATRECHVVSIVWRYFPLLFWVGCRSLKHKLKRRYMLRFPLFGRQFEIFRNNRINYEREKIKQSTFFAWERRLWGRSWYFKMVNGKSSSILEALGLNSVINGAVQAGLAPVKGRHGTIRWSERRSIGKTSDILWLCVMSNYSSYTHIYPLKYSLRSAIDLLIYCDSFYFMCNVGSTNPILLQVLKAFQYFDCTGFKVVPAFGDILTITGKNLFNTGIKTKAAQYHLGCWGVSCRILLRSWRRSVQDWETVRLSSVSIRDVRVSLEARLYLPPGHRNRNACIDGITSTSHHLVKIMGHSCQDRGAHGGIAGPGETGRGSRWGDGSVFTIHSSVIY